MSQSSQTWDERNEPIDYTVSREKNWLLSRNWQQESISVFIITDAILGLQEKVHFFVHENDRERGVDDFVRKRERPVWIGL
ncbi:MAG: hypothetical protein ACLTZT_14940 [Butyricimonas faecalis]